MKKQYNQPVIVISEIMPMTVICVSLTNGGPTSSITPPGGGEINND